MGVAWRGGGRCIMPAALCVRRAAGWPVGMAFWCDCLCQRGLSGGTVLRCCRRRLMTRISLCRALVAGWTRAMPGRFSAAFCSAGTLAQRRTTTVWPVRFSASTGFVWRGRCWSAFHRIGARPEPLRHAVVGFCQDVVRIGRDRPARFSLWAWRVFRPWLRRGAACCWHAG